MVAFFLLFLGLLFHFALRVLNVLWLRPQAAERFFRRQGLRGPPYRFLLGNLGEMVSMMVNASAKPMMPPFSHNVLSRAVPFFHHWKKAYGSVFVLWFGTTPRLVVADPGLVREIFVSRSEFFDRYEAHPLVRQLEGEGLVNLSGPQWALHRKLIAPVFYMDNLKQLMPAVGETMRCILDKVSAAAAEAAGGAGEVEMDVSDWYQSLTEDAVTRMTFGRSYDEGKTVLRLQAKLMVYAAEAFNRVFIPGYRFLPTAKNRMRWKLDREIRESLLRLVGCRREVEHATAGEAIDLLGQMTTAEAGVTVNDIVEECKTFFFAGKQTTTNLLTWTTVLLAMHPDWQERARDEIRHVCGSRELPSKEDLHKLKTLGMIVNETLRLYPPAVATIRRARADVQLGGYRIPQGTEILVPIIAVHHDPGLWGPDADQFNPSRFVNGACRAARHPNAFMPFGLGERTCVGRGLAMLEAKMALVAVLQRFELRLSANYVHAPTVLMMLYPQYGAPVVFRPISKNQ